MGALTSSQRPAGPQWTQGSPGKSPPCTPAPASLCCSFLSLRSPEPTPGSALTIDACRLRGLTPACLGLHLGAQGT